MKLAWEEQFGPVLPFVRVEDMFTAVKHCNDSKLALQGCVFTANINTAMKLSDAMKTGTVQVGTCVYLQTRRPAVLDAFSQQMSLRVNTRTLNSTTCHSSMCLVVASMPQVALRCMYQTPSVR